MKNYLLVFLVFVCFSSFAFSDLQRISKHHGDINDHNDNDGHNNRCHDEFTTSECPVGLNGGKYYYDLKNHECLQYENGKCGPKSTTNSFETLEDCIEVCGNHQDRQ